MWRAEEVGRHLPAGQVSNNVILYTPLQEGRVVVSEPIFVNDYLRVWDAKSGKSILTVRGKVFSRSPRARFLLALDKELARLRFVHRESGREFSFPLRVVPDLGSPPRFKMKVAFSPESERMALVGDGEGRHLRVFSIMEGVEVSSRIFDAEPAEFYLNSDGSMAVIQEGGGSSRVALWSIKGSADSLKSLVTENSGTALAFAAHSAKGLVAVFEKESSGKHSIQLYSLRTGNHLRGRDLSGLMLRKFRLWFSKSGDFLLFKTYDSGLDAGRYVILSVGDLLPADFAPAEGLRFMPSNGREPILAWPIKQGGVMLWRFGGGAPRFLKGLSLESVPDGALLNRKGDRLAIVRVTGVVELWDVLSGRQVARIKLANRARGVAFSLEDGVLVVAAEGGYNLFYDASTGHEIASSLVVISDWPATAHYEECGRLNVWHADGRVLQYVKGIKVPWLPFLRTAHCGKAI